MLLWARTCSGRRPSCLPDWWSCTTRASHRPSPMTPGISVKKVSWKIVGSNPAMEVLFFSTLIRQHASFQDTGFSRYFFRRKREKESCRESRSDVHNLGCQMVRFQTKNTNLGKFSRVLRLKMLVYFMAIWHILRIFWYILRQIGIFYPFWCVVARNIRQQST
jgi:hypothetical protein